MKGLHESVALFFFKCALQFSKSQRFGKFTDGMSIFVFMNTLMAFGKCFIKNTQVFLNRRLARTCIPVLFLMFASFSCSASGLKGTYTIDPSGSGATNFISFTDAVVELQDSGVAGPVIFNIADGVYYESPYLDSAIKGTSATKTITFQSQSLDSTKVIVNGGSYFAFTLDNISYVTIRLMTISTDLATGIGVFIEDQSSHNTIERCVIWKNNDGIYLNSNSYLNVKDNVIRYNHISGLSMGIEIESSIYSMVSDLTISNNLIDSSLGSIYVFRSEHLIISDNKLLAPVTMYLNYSSGTKDVSVISNNFIYAALDTTEYSAALIIQEFSGINVFDNSVYSKARSALWSFKVLDKSQVKNNIFCNAGGGTSIEADDGTLVNYDHNDLYSNGKFLSINGSNICANLAAWQKKTKMDAHSISVFPFFKDTASSDLHLTILSPISLDSGIYIAPDSLDIDGDKRNKIHTWMGADEYVADTIDAGITSILYPLNNNCGDSNMGVMIKVHNFGVRNINNFKIGVFVSGASNDSADFYYSDSLQSGKDTILSVAFSNPWNTSPGGFYKIRAFTILHGDQFPGNDSTEVNIKINTVPKTPSVLLKGNDTLVASYTGDSCQWYLDSVVVSSGKCEYVATKSGKYQVLVYDIACPSPMSAVYNFTFVGIEGLSKDDVISIYPNPTNSKLYITQHPPTPFKGGLTQAHATITDINGRILLTQPIITTESTIDVSTLPSGIYLLRYQDADKVWNGKFIKQ